MLDSSKYKVLLYLLCETLDPFYDKASSSDKAVNLRSSTVSEELVKNYRVIKLMIHYRRQYSSSHLIFTKWINIDAHSSLQVLPGPLISGSDCLVRVPQTTSLLRGSSKAAGSHPHTLLIIYRTITLSRAAPPRWHGRYWASLWRRILYYTFEKVHGESANLTRFETKQILQKSAVAVLSF